MKNFIFILFLLISFSTNAYSNINKHLLNEMFTTLNNKYLEPINNENLISTGLSALNDIDKNITISKGNTRFYIYFDRQIYKAVAFPQDRNDINGWVDTTSAIIEAASEKSAEISLKDFQIPDLIMKKMALVLDKYSRYFSEYEYHEEENNNTIYTLYSDRIIDDILYIRLRIFNKQTEKAVKKSLNDNTDVKGVIIDLRGNSGGMFNEALKVAGLFIDNAIITYTAGRNNSNIHYYTSKDNTIYDGPLIILVDGKTASAAEVLAGGLQEQSRAKIIGTRTFGKGTIQNIIQMSNKGKLVLTTEQFYTPSGKVIHKHGIIPDICLEKDNNNNCIKNSRLHNDEDIDTAIKILKNEF